jgi:hypothetical protein
VRWLLLPVALSLSFAPVATAALPSPCALLTNTQVATELGGRNAETRSMDGNGLCTWAGPAMGYFTAGHPHFFLQVRRESEASFYARFDKLTSQRPPEAVPVLGVGQAAFSTHNGLMLAVWQRGITVQISGSFLSASPQTDIRVAQAALKRLKHVAYPSPARPV